ncbi:MAG: hypothetical protein B1H13_00325 [Desulfobacteraceae bacterium 4484_190.3]|nr:MAG: hypothetical protein B1H13_00325 [Desulfobacteraceae bacterium 4484_190.3]
MVEICETILLEAQQSGSMDASEILAGAKLLDGIGYRAIEVMPPVPEVNDWGQIKKIRQAAKSTPLLVSANVDSVSAESLGSFIESGAINGVDIFRVYDRANNLGHLERAMKIIGRTQKTAECTITYNHGQDTEAMIKTFRAFKAKGCTSFCLSDAIGVLGPQKTIELLTLLKKETNTSIALRISSAPGLAAVAYYAAAGAGVDSLYCELSPFYVRQSLPQTGAMVSALSGSDWETGLNLDALDKAGRHFKKIGARGPRAYDVDVSGNRYHVVVHPSGVDAEITPATQVKPGSSRTLGKPGPAKSAAPTRITKARTRPVDFMPAEKQTMRGIKKVPSTMEGTILDVLIKEGDTVERGTELLVLEAMKMQNQVLCPVSGTVAEILVKVGETVKDGQDLVTIRISG